MTDKEMLLHIINKLQLKETENPNIDNNEYAINEERNIIYIGAGEGYDKFYTEFWFDNEGNVISHAVAE